MSFEFNDPKFEPGKGQLPPHQFKSGVAFERHKKIVEGVIAGLKLKTEQVSDLEQLWREAQVRIKNVRQYGEMIADEHAEVGRTMDPKVFAEDIQNKYMNNFVHYSKDQLLVILTTHLSILTVEGIV
jgi:hypothetical protein